MKVGYKTQALLEASENSKLSIEGVLSEK